MSLICMFQTSRIKLDQIRSNWIKVDQNGLEWIIMDQIGLDKHDMAMTKMKWSWKKHDLDKHGHGKHVVAWS